MTWNEEDHLLFYDNLRSLDARSQSQALISKARLVLQESKNADDLKGAESLLTFWQLHAAHPEDKMDAYTLFYHLYQRLEEPEKAKKFLVTDS